mmetsp:Transcript_85605/g.135176  ORF Transcript_85605/g.135176 Transcript_85605/m.135176 type:complete len:168 (+) Transcript_85605:77-580(+)
MPLLASTGLGHGLAKAYPSAFPGFHLKPDPPNGIHLEIEYSPRQAKVTRAMAYDISGHVGVDVPEVDREALQKAQDKITSLSSSDGSLRQMIREITGNIGKTIEPLPPDIFTVKPSQETDLAGTVAAAAMPVWLLSPLAFFPFRHAGPYRNHCSCRARHVERGRAFL